jgi:hypothetical protein
MLNKSKIALAAGLLFVSSASSSAERTRPVIPALRGQNTKLETSQQQPKTTYEAVDTYVELSEHTTKTLKEAKAILENATAVFKKLNAEAIILNKLPPYMTITTTEDIRSLEIENGLSIGFKREETYTTIQLRYGEKQPFFKYYLAADPQKKRYIVITEKSSDKERGEEELHHLYELLQKD